VADVRVYEPALCCRTGVCGPDLDQVAGQVVSEHRSRGELLRFAGVAAGSDGPSLVAQGARPGLPLVTASSEAESCCPPGSGEGCC